MRTMHTICFVLVLAACKRTDEPAPSPPAPSTTTTTTTAPGSQNLAPLAGIASAYWAQVSAPVVGALAVAAMAAAYAPLVRFYGLPSLWALTLPAAAALFLAMTWSSAVNYWRGTRATWKNRSYESLK